MTVFAVVIRLNSLVLAINENIKSITYTSRRIISAGPSNDFRFTTATRVDTMR